MFGQPECTKIYYLDLGNGPKILNWVRSVGDINYELGIGAQLDFVLNSNGFIFFATGDIQSSNLTH